MVWQVQCAEGFSHQTTWIILFKWHTSYVGKWGHKDFCHRKGIVKNDKQNVTFGNPDSSHSLIMPMKSIDLAAINSALNADMTEFNSKALQWTQHRSIQLNTNSNSVLPAFTLIWTFYTNNCPASIINFKKRKNKEKKKGPHTNWACFDKD